MLIARFSIVYKIFRFSFTFYSLLFTFYFIFLKLFCFQLYGTGHLPDNTITVYDVYVRTLWIHKYFMVFSPFAFPCTIIIHFDKLVLAFVYSIQCLFFKLNSVFRSLSLWLNWFWLVHFHLIHLYTFIQFCVYEYCFVAAAAFLFF